VTKQSCCDNKLVLGRHAVENQTGQGNTSSFGKAKPVHVRLHPTSGDILRICPWLARFVVRRPRVFTRWPARARVLRAVLGPISIPQSLSMTMAPARVLAALPPVQRTSAHGGRKLFHAYSSTGRGAAGPPIRTRWNWIFPRTRRTHLPLGPTIPCLLRPSASPKS
jgi:hypothetical protein